MSATKAYKLKSTLKGSFDHVRGKVVYYGKLKRDMGTIIRFKDAQLIVKNMIDRKSIYLNYYFYYRCDENQVLNAMFWADETSKAYYSEFGDAMSFNATFCTNKLVFMFLIICH